MGRVLQVDAIIIEFLSALIFEDLLVMKGGGRAFSHLLMFLEGLYRLHVPVPTRDRQTLWVGVL